MKKILVIDWLDKFGGAERVIASICAIITFDKCYALVNVMSPQNIKKTFSGQSIQTKESILKYTGKRFRHFFMFFPFIIRKIKIPKDVDLIISSSHAVAKGIRKSRNNQIHFSYFQARNQKYIWSDYKLYFGKMSPLIFPIISYLRKLDVRDSRNPDYIISNSEFVKNWIKEVYGRDSHVIYPPVDLSNFPLKSRKENYYVTVGRIEPYKRFDLIIEAFNINKKKLVVIGDGTQLKKLKKIAGDNIEFTGYLDSEKICEYISTAKAFVHAGMEDFGIAPIEAQSCGTPVIAYGFGGVLETVIEDKTGIFFKEQNPESLLMAIEKFEQLNFEPQLISKNAERFKKTNFETELKNYIAKKIKTHDEVI